MLRSCEQYNARLMLYQDNELDNAEKRVIEAHLKSCSACWSVFSRERRFLEGIRRTRPLHVAPDEVRTRVASVLNSASRGRENAPSKPQRGSALSRAGGLRKFWNQPAALGIIASLLVVAGTWGTALVLNPRQSVTFAAMAVDAHQRHQLGQLPLEVASDSSVEISSWFTDKVPFTLKLPNYRDASGQDKRYRLEGARLVGFQEDYAAYVAYQMQQHPISLVVTSASVATPSGGETIASKGIVFHYETIAGLKVISWSHRDLTYALVSDLKERGQQSCLVCHQGMKDQDFIESLTSGIVHDQITAVVGSRSPHAR